LAQLLAEKSDFDKYLLKIRQRAASLAQLLAEKLDFDKYLLKMRQRAASLAQLLAEKSEFVQNPTKCDKGPQVWRKQKRHL
jgi:broad specificity phosphatase PhoE